MQLSFDLVKKHLLPRNHYTQKDYEGFYRAQQLALDGAASVAKMIMPGWTEVQAADLLNTWLRDHGVSQFFHYTYAWFGDRTRFAGISRRLYHQFMPSRRRLADGEVFILDVAPIVEGYVCDIGYSAVCGQHHGFTQAQELLGMIRAEIPQLVSAQMSGAAIWRSVDQMIVNAGFENIHKLYPFEVLGHQVHRVQLNIINSSVLNFGLQAFWEIGGRGIFNQLWNLEYKDPLADGIWAVEPHVGGEDFGAKFEEILVVKNGTATWLSDICKGPIT